MAESPSEVSIELARSATDGESLSEDAIERIARTIARAKREAKPVAALRIARAALEVHRRGREMRYRAEPIAMGPAIDRWRDTMDRLHDLMDELTEDERAAIMEGRNG